MTWKQRREALDLLYIFSVVIISLASWQVKGQLLELWKKTNLLESLCDKGCPVSLAPGIPLTRDMIAKRAWKIPTGVWIHGWISAMQTRQEIQNVSFVGTIITARLDQERKQPEWPETGVRKSTEGRFVPAAARRIVARVRGSRSSDLSCLVEPSAKAGNFLFCSGSIWRYSCDPARLWSIQPGLARFAEACSPRLYPQWAEACMFSSDFGNQVDNLPAPIFFLGAIDAQGARYRVKTF